MLKSATGSSRLLVSSDSPWESPVGFSRAVRVGRQVFVSGTVAAEAYAGDVYAQARSALQRIETALNEAGAELNHVVRTRMYVTDISQWPQVAQAHHDFFGAIRPATSMVEVSRLIAPEFLVEIEADAIVEPE